MRGRRRKEGEKGGNDGETKNSFEPGSNGRLIPATCNMHK
jgi:hypothetical protein